MACGECAGDPLTGRTLYQDEREDVSDCERDANAANDP